MEKCLKLNASVDTTGMLARCNPDRQHRRHDSCGGRVERNFWASFAGCSGCSRQRCSAHPYASPLLQLGPAIRLSKFDPAEFVTAQAGSRSEHSRSVWPEQPAPDLIRGRRAGRLQSTRGGDRCTLSLRQLQKTRPEAHPVIAGLVKKLRERDCSPLPWGSPSLPLGPACGCRCCSWQICRTERVRMVLSLRHLQKTRPEARFL